MSEVKQYKHPKLGWRAKRETSITGALSEFWTFRDKEQYRHEFIEEEIIALGFKPVEEPVQETQEKDWIEKVFEETRKQEVVHWTQLGRANSATPETVAKVREEITKRNILKFMPQLKTEGTIPVVKVDLQGTYKIVDGENKGEFLWNSDAIIKAKNFDKTEVSDTSNIVKDLTIEVWERHMQKPTYRNELRGIIKKHLGKSVDTPSDREKNLLVKLKLVGDYKLAPEETLKKRISEHRNAVIDDCKDFIKKNNPPRKKGVEFKGRNLGVADCLKSLEQLKTPL